MNDTLENTGLDNREQDPNRIPDPLPKEDPSRKRAESTASPLTYSNLLLKNYLEQTFEINSKVRVRMRTVSAKAAETLFRIVSTKYRNEFAAVFEEKLRHYYLAAALIQFNDQSLTPPLEEIFAEGLDAEQREKLFSERMDMVEQLPLQVVTLLYAHYLLFSNRVEDFIRTGGDDLGN